MKTVKRRPIPVEAGARLPYIWDMLKTDKAGKLWAVSDQSLRELWLALCNLDYKQKDVPWSRLKAKERWKLNQVTTLSIWFFCKLSEAIERIRI